MQPNLNDVVSALESGQLREADQRCRLILSHDPGNSAAWHLLGVIAGKAGQHEDAAQLMRKSVEMAPQHGAFRSNLARALMHLGRFDEAGVELSEALRLNPDAPQLHLCRGTILAKQDQPAAAIECFEQALRLDPQLAAAHFHIGEVHRQSGDTDAALAKYNETLTLDPRNADALNNLAGLLVDRGDFVDAVVCIQKALQLKPRSAQAYCNLGVALRAAGDVKQAIVAYQNSIKLDPTATIPRYDLAMQLIAMGDLNEAETCLDDLEALGQDDPRIVVGRARLLERHDKIEEAAELLKPVFEAYPTMPAVAGAYAILLEQQGELETAASTLQAAIDYQQASAIDGIAIRFQLGKICDRLGRFDESFENYRIGNQNRRKAFPVPFAVEESIEELRQISETYAADRMRGYPRSTNDSDVPIFIVGMPRSGTSLVEQILSSHPRVFGAGELTDLRDLIRSTHRVDTGPPASGLSVKQHESKASSVIPYGMDQITAEQLDALATKYLEKLRSLSDADRITDKMPYNFLYLGFIRLLFPNARIIHCQRHPLDTCVSCYFQNFFLGNQVTFDLTDLGIFYRHYTRVMDHWRSIDVPFLDVQYEDVITDVESQAKRMLEYCDLEWDERCLRFHESPRVVKTASYQQVRQPIYQTSADRWKNYQTHLKPLIEALELDESQMGDVKK